MRRRALCCTLLAGVLAAGCAGTPQVRQAAPAGHPPLESVLVLVDTDVIGAAFAAYQGSVPFGSRTGNWHGFITHLTEGLRAEARKSGIDAAVEAVSLRAAPPVARGARAVLTVRASAFTRLKEFVGDRDLGWRGDTSWEFSLLERDANGRFATTWSAGLRHVNLNPALCGNYEGCSQSLAQQVFRQLRESGLAR